MTTNAGDRVYSDQVMGTNVLALAGDDTNGYTASLTIHLPITTEYSDTLGGMPGDPPDGGLGAPPGGPRPDGGMGGGPPGAP